MSGSPPLQLFNQSGSAVPVNEQQALRMVRLVEEGEQCAFSLLELAYVDEQRIVEINREYLDREYVTDIITFRYDEEDPGGAPSAGDEDSLETQAKKPSSGIEGTLYCCAPRIREQAEELGEPQDREFLRILVHGLLHLAGYGDDTPSRKKEMTRREEHYLALAER